MTTDSRRRGYSADVARQAHALNLDALRVLDRVASHLVRRQLEGGPLTLEAMRGWTRDPRDIDDTTVVLDEAIAAIADLIVLEDQEREELHEQARAEMVGELGGEG